MTNTWTTPDGAHSVELQPSNSGKRIAWCRCGWQGTTRLSSGPATRDGMDHLATVTHAAPAPAPICLGCRLPEEHCCCGTI